MSRDPLLFLQKKIPRTTGEHEKGSKKTDYTLKSLDTERFLEVSALDNRNIGALDQATVLAEFYKRSAAALAFCNQISLH